MKKKFILVLGICLVSVIIVFAVIFSSKEKIEILETKKIKRCDIHGFIVETGIIQPRVGALVKIGARTTGLIEEMYVKIGDQVTKGMLIALIDDREMKKEITRTKAELEVAKSKLRQIQDLFPKRIDEARSLVDAKKSNYALQEKNLKRSENLYNKGYISKGEHDDQVTKYDESQSEMTIAEKAYLRVLKEFETEKNIAESEIKKFKSMLEQEKIRLSYTKIYSPMDGIVADVTAQEGETIVAGLQVANLITVLNPELLEMRIYVDETEIGRIKKGQNVSYTVDTYPERVFNAMVDEIYPQPEIRDNIVYYLAIAHIPSEDARHLRPDMTTHVKILADTRTAVLCVPNSAMKYEAGRNFVYRVKGRQKVERVFIQTGLRGEDMTEGVSGINEGDVVATRLIIPVDLDEVKGNNQQRR